METKEKKSVMFIKPALEIDGVFDPIRTTNYLGVWYMASLLKEKGHKVRCLDEVIRDGGLEKRRLFERKIVGVKVVEESLEISYKEFQEQKMKDFYNLSPKEFTQKYSAFRIEAEINRTIVRTGNSIEETLEEVDKTKPDLVGIPLIATANYSQSVKLGKAIKEKFPQIKIIYGGQHFLDEHEEFIQKNPWVDQIVLGDAITVIEDIIEGRKKEKIINGGFQTMDKFPLLDPSIIEENNYPLDPTYAYTSSGRKTIDYMFSRGCFRRCDFCVAGSQKGNHLTQTEYDKIDKQLKIFWDYGIREIIVQDDAFIPAQKEQAISHLKKILGMMKKYGFYWQNNGGIDFELLNDEVTDLFIKYNQEGEGKITALYVPFNPRGTVAQKSKSVAGVMTTKHHDHLKNLKRLREEAGIYVFFSEIIGTPEQTTKILEKDIELHKNLVRDGYLDAALTLIATSLPATKWYGEHRQDIINEKDYAGYSLFTAHSRTKNIPNPIIIEEFMVRRTKELREVQITPVWGSAFPD